MRRPRRSFSTRTCWASAIPSSHGSPACLIEESGEAPVPPSWPEMVMWSAFAFATPAAMVPIPSAATTLSLFGCDPPYAPSQSGPSFSSNSKSIPTPYPPARGNSIPKEAHSRRKNASGTCSRMPPPSPVSGSPPPAPRSRTRRHHVHERGCRGLLQSSLTSFSKQAGLAVSNVFDSDLLFRDQSAPNLLSHISLRVAPARQGLYKGEHLPFCNLVDSSKLDHGVRVFVHPEVQVRVGLVLRHAYRGALAPPLVPSGRLSGLQRSHQALPERLLCGRLECYSHRQEYLP